jgi:FkbM family methyltransferase
MNEVAALRTLGRLRQQRRFLVRYYGLHELDRKIEPFIDFDRGTFFEAGANDGLSQSNTAHFEIDRGWTGILVEPIPIRFEEAKRNRPNSKCVNAALVPPDYTADTVPLLYCNLMTTTVDSRSVVDSKVHAEKGRHLINRVNEEPYEFTAPPRTISSILDEFEISRIDLMSLDIEGFEHIALQGLDHDRHLVKFICIEARILDKVMQNLGGLYVVREKISHHDYILERIVTP